MNILIIDNNMERPFWGSQDLCRMARLAQDATVSVRRGPQQDLPLDPERFDKIIVSGSYTSCLAEGPWIDKLLEFIRKAIGQKKSFLGVCFGHQMLVRAIAGKEKLRKAASPEFGWTRIKVTDSSTLLNGLPTSFYTFSSHFEEVSELPPNMKKLAESDLCSIQACQLNNSPVFGIQFHPEKNEPETEKALQRMKKEKSLNKKLLNPTRGHELYNPKIGETLFKNFLKL